MIRRSHQFSRLLTGLSRKRMSRFLSISALPRHFVLSVVALCVLLIGLNLIHHFNIIYIFVITLNTNSSSLII